ASADRGGSRATVECNRGAASSREFEPPASRELEASRSSRSIQRTLFLIMQIHHLAIRNYRTLESVDIDLPGFYSAISGKKNCGKTNVVNVIRSFFEQGDEAFFVDEEPTISMKTDFPNWKQFEETKDSIVLEMSLHVHRERDAGLFRFITTFLGLTDAPDELG